MAEVKKQIWILDDDESVCRALRCLLITYGFEVNAYLSAGKFFKAVPPGSSGCLILDLHMPVVDGWEVLKQLAKAGFKLPVIVISADKNDGLKELALRSGAAGFFQKPVNGSELVELINLKLMGKWRKQ